MESDGILAIDALYREVLVIAPLLFIVCDNPMLYVNDPNERLARIQKYYLSGIPRKAHVYIYLSEFIMTFCR